MSVMRFKKGDKVKIGKNLHFHYGIATGEYDGDRIEIINIVDIDNIGYVKREFIDAGPLDPVTVDNSTDNALQRLHLDEILKRAESRVGTETEYSRWSNNCEHFVNWCRYGVKLCQQTGYANVEPDSIMIGTPKLSHTISGPNVFVPLSASVGPRLFAEESPYRRCFLFPSLQPSWPKLRSVPVKAKDRESFLSSKTGFESEDGRGSAQVLGTGVSWDDNAGEVTVNVLGSSATCVIS